MGCYRRGTYRTDTIYTFYDYKDVYVQYAREKCYVTDYRAKRMAGQDLISPEQAERLQKALHTFFCGFTTLDAFSVEELYEKVCEMRTECLGREALRNDLSARMSGKWKLPERGLWQEGLRRKLMAKKEVLLFALCQPELLSFLRADFEEASAAGKKCILITGDGMELPEEEQFRELGFGLSAHFLGKNLAADWLCPEGEASPLSGTGIAVNPGNAALFVYGEEGFLRCRNLLLPAMVLGVPRGYYARAVTGQFGAERICLVYIPAHFDIIPAVPLTERTCLSFRQLVCLCERFGPSVYSMTPGELYLRYPQYFLSMYDTGTDCLQAAEDFPLQIHFPTDMSSNDECTVLQTFCRLRDQKIRFLLESRSTPGNPIRYFSAYFNSNFSQMQVPWYPSQKLDGILVQGLRCARAKNACVLKGAGKLDLKQAVKGQKKGQVSVLSNFLFFQTEKLATFYNELRADRPREQMEFRQEHLDYMLDMAGGQRLETFPLYNKACVGMKEDGSFLFFHFRLGGGEISFRWADTENRQQTVLDAPADTPPCQPTPWNKLVLRWDSCHVDPQTADKHAPILIYTPYYSQKDLASPSEDYRLLAGENRVNLVIIQNRIVCVRRGSVVLPGIGVVVSLSPEAAAPLLADLPPYPADGHPNNSAQTNKLSGGSAQNNDHSPDSTGAGYYSPASLTFSLRLAPPTGISEKEWAQMRWAYGGGLSLIEGGDDVFSNGSKTPPDLLQDEGWLTPLSQQTQDTPIHKLALHPRTAIGSTKNGDVFLLVFSGRSLLSRGADYVDMCRIARALIPDVQTMMNVDGGASSVLGLAVDGSFLEVSLPASSNDNVAGMARPVVTALCLEL